MNPIFEDNLNLKLLEYICSGFGVEININELSSILNVHRSTIKKKYNHLIEKKIIKEPISPLNYLIREFPLLVIEKGDFPRDPAMNDFIELDSQIWLAFFKKVENYNTILIELQKSMYDYQEWDEKRRNLLGNYPSEAYFISTRSFMKYFPSSAVKIMENDFKDRRNKIINKMGIDELSLKLLKALTEGEGIRINYSALSRKMDINRRTIQRRIEKFLSEKIIAKPCCRFPRIWVPPEYIFVITLYEIKQKKDLVVRSLIADPHISLLSKVNIRNYNLMSFSSFYNVEKSLTWFEEYNQRFPQCFGKVENITLSPEMTFSIDQQYISLEFIKNCQDKLRGKMHLDLMKNI